MVFKKLADRLHSASTAAANAVSNTLAPSSDQPQQQYMNEIIQLESMGFMSERARQALNATNGNVDRAAELLFLSEEGDDDDGESLP
jgi:division protein CdvB (Snf7/Vps24/ESCRT-III family)